MRLRIVIFLSIVLLISFVLLNLKYTIKFEEIQCLTPKNELNPINSTIRPWFSIRNEKYNPWHDLEYIKDMEIDYDNWNLDEYTYIICQGYELKKISFSPLLLNIKSDFQIEYIGITQFEEDFSNRIFIYRIKKKNIDFMYDELGAYSKFGDFTCEELLTTRYNISVGDN